MSRESEEPAASSPSSLWVRWDNGHSDADGTTRLPHRYCDIWPFDGNSEAKAMGDRPRTRNGSPIEYLTGMFRLCVRNTPTLVLFTTLVLLVSAELTPGVEGISVYLPAEPTIYAMGIVSVPLWAALLWLAVDVGFVEPADLLKASVFYGVAVFLVAGTLFSIYLTATQNPENIANNIVFTFGYMLLHLVGGILVYDGMLKTEHLFGNLEMSNVVPDDRLGAYERFKIDLQDDLTHYTLGVRTAYSFALLFLLQFVFVWLFRRGPQNLDFVVTLLVNIVGDVFIIVVAFQFLVLVKHFHMLVTDSVGSSGQTAIEYRPFHPDGRGGFRDLGRFATRVNEILILGGLYVVYRFFVQGVRAFPGADGSLAVGDPMLFFWLLNYMGPVVAYGVATGVWLYYSFWHLHRKMKRERNEFVERLKYDDGPPTATKGYPGLGSFEDGEQWQTVYNKPAPVWPTPGRQMISLVLGNLVPVISLFLTIPRVFSLL